MADIGTECGIVLLFSVDCFLSPLKRIDRFFCCCCCCSGGPSVKRLIETRVGEYLTWFNGWPRFNYLFYGRMKWNCCFQRISTDEPPVTLKKKWLQFLVPKRTFHFEEAIRRFTIATGNKLDADILWSASKRKSFPLSFDILWIDRICSGEPFMKKILYKRPRAKSRRFVEWWTLIHGYQIQLVS